MIKVAAIGVAAAILAAWIKSVKSEYGIWIFLTSGIILGMFCIGKLETMVLELQFLQSYFSDYGAYIKLLLKVLGITYLSEFAASICKDAGYGSVAGQIDLIGKLTVLSVSMPVILALLEAVSGFLLL